ncbi:FAD-binding oxidoreductase [Uliginosibacterium sp. 31-16]|uniref:FAD-binding oxidoreductase n=1 Tax=Uliginosibacterium sp. 31-16 TaxID=3068315 RepID=UPI00273E36C6|nr:FAD-binding oxidoreductase [Uliginosibacterium sp. 31-16]MDP5241414.1 FAD-binding oxidoreductase [Uliginosibacterium sp. 31-16]
MKQVLIDRLRGIVGEGHVLASSEACVAYEEDWRGRYKGRALCVVRPGSTEEVSAVVRACAEAGVAMVPQGGNTGLVGGGVPHECCDEVVISLQRLQQIRAIDPGNDTITVEAGCTLAAVQATAEEHSRLFPLSLASEGTCQIGGNLASNAGGVQVLRYGNARELTLGLEVVLPNGDVWNGLRGLRKDNTGYDLKQLFIGSEGTLGIITAAVLKLFPLPTQRAVAWVGLPEADAAISLLALLRQGAGSRVTAFEIVCSVAHELVLQKFPDARRPLRGSAPWYALIELTDSGDGAGLNVLLEAIMERAFEASLISDAVLASSEAQAQALWMLRENISEAQKKDGVSIKHDVSVPVSLIPEFLRRSDAALQERFPGVRIVAFGHAGDGNLHYNPSMPEALANAAFVARTPEVNRIVHDIVASLGGSISAEHGLGQLKREEIKRYKSPVELEMMRSVKQAFDPAGLMNPGKLLG